MNNSDQINKIILLQGIIVDQFINKSQQIIIQ